MKKFLFILGMTGLAAAISIPLMVKNEKAENSGALIVPKLDTLKPWTDSLAIDTTK